MNAFTFPKRPCHRAASASHFRNRETGRLVREVTMATDFTAGRAGIVVIVYREVLGNSKRLTGPTYVCEWTDFQRQFEDAEAKP